MFGAAGSHIETDPATGPRALPAKSALAKRPAIRPAVTRLHSALALALPVLVDDDCGDDNDALDDFLVVGAYFEEGEARGHHAEDDRADDRARDAADAARQRG